MDITSALILIATSSVGVLKVAAIAYGIVLLINTIRKPLASKKIMTYRPS
jgi:hypothetical protein